MHYDLRLKVCGLLKSWAVPKGPTLDLAKTLSLAVEDYPLEQTDFEGGIQPHEHRSGEVTLENAMTFQTTHSKPLEEQLGRKPGEPGAIALSN